jgi:hypothetical protein
MNFGFTVLFSAIVGYLSFHSARMKKRGFVRDLRGSARAPSLTTPIKLQLFFNFLTALFIEGFKTPQG